MSHLHLLHRISTNSHRIVTSCRFFVSSSPITGIACSHCHLLSPSSHRHLPLELHLDAHIVSPYPTYRIHSSSPIDRSIASLCITHLIMSHQHLGIYYLTSASCQSHYSFIRISLVAVVSQVRLHPHALCPVPTHVGRLFELEQLESFRLSPTPHRLFELEAFRICIWREIVNSHIDTGTL